MMRVNIIGAGSVGRTFARLLGDRLGDVASKTKASAERAVRDAGHGRAADPRDMRAADLWMITVPDTEIASAARELSVRDVPPAVAVHCSGFHGADVMEGLRDAGWMLASAHPNLSFAEPETAAARFPGTPCGVEGDLLAVAAIEALLAQLGARPFRIASDHKALYHAAAVFSNNFATVLQAVARTAWKDAGVPDEIATELNASLLRATCDNVIRQGPRDALTGPAARGDMEVVGAQGKVVADWNEAAGRLYGEMSAMAARLKSTGAI